MKNIIQQDGKQWMKCSLVMLPTDKITNLILETKNNNLFFTTSDIINSIMQYQHLYILSDEEIKVNDYQYCKLHSITKASNLLWTKQENCKKIIVTTNPELIIKDWLKIGNDMKGGKYEQLNYIPQIPQEFIQEFIKANGKGFEEVLVEVNSFSELSGKYPDIYKLKLSSDNSVNIKSNFEYLENFINQFEKNHNLQELSNEDWTVSQFLKWLKINNFKIIKLW